MKPVKGDTWVKMTPSARHITREVIAVDDSGRVDYQERVKLYGGGTQARDGSCAPDTWARWTTGARQTVRMARHDT